MRQYFGEDRMRRLSLQDLCSAVIGFCALSSAMLSSPRSLLRRFEPTLGRDMLRR